MITIQNLDYSGKLAIEIAQKLAEDHNHKTFGPAHLLMATLNARVGLTSLLSSMDKDLAYLKSWAQYRIDEYPSTGLSVNEPEADQDAQNTLQVAKTFKLMFNHKRIKAVSILAALTRPGVGFPLGKIGALRLKENELTAAVLSDASLEAALNEDSNSNTSSDSQSIPSSSPKQTQTFLQFCVDQIALAQNGKIDPIFGREEEISKLESILCRRSKPNVILIGEPGVGKTALVDGFALNIANGEVSTFFKDAKLYQLDIGALIAGASYKGEIEDRLKKILSEIKRLEKVILFIDEIHLILDPNSGASGIANLLKPELARGELNVIGATTTKEFRLHVEKDAAFNRRFETLMVEAPDVKNATKMVNGLKALFEEHHQFTVNDETILQTVKLAKRYFPQRQLPDSAIDLLDQTMASFRILEDNIDDRMKKVSMMMENKQNSSWKEFWKESVHILTPLALAEIEHKTPEEEASQDEWKDYIDQTLALLKEKFGSKREAINQEQIGAVVSVRTGIPIGKIQGAEQQRLFELEDILKARVIGQDHAAGIIAEAIRRSRSGMKEKGKPIGSFFFVGPTGTGKTELAKAITETLFNEKNNLLRFDMSEFMESHTVSLLKGSPPGYVGFGDGGMLVNQIRSKPYSVVLFDEVEKAHPDVLKLMLQILDEGHLHDTLGKKGNFADAVIIFTSNLQSDWIVDQFKNGVIPRNEAMPKEVEDTLKERIMGAKDYNLKPEFLNRLDAIIPFAPLSKNALVKILDLQLKRFAKPLRERNIQMKLTQAAKELLVDKGYTPAFGARPLKRVIDNYLGTKISDMIIRGAAKPGGVIEIDTKNGELTFQAS